MTNALTLEEQLKQGLIEPGQPFKILQYVEMQFQESDLADMKEQNKQFILTESEGKAGQKKHLLVTVEGIHTGMTKNQTFYPGTTLEASVPTWVEPHQKPVIKNHNAGAEPMGRIIESEYVESTLTDKYTVRLKLKVTDPDAIEKILDGRYLTLSVGGSAKRVNCSVCSKDLVKEGWCGHSRGRTYEGKTAHWTIGEYTGDEISFVNMPADVHSQVIKVELISEGGENMEDEKKSKESTAETTPGAVKTTESETDLIDGLLDDGVKTAEGVNSDNDEKDKEPAASASTTTESTDGDSTPTPAVPVAENDNTDTPEAKLAEATQKLADLQAKHDTLLGENTTLTADLKAAEAKVTDLTTQVADKQTHLESAEAEKKSLTEQNITLARFARRSMAERVADLTILQGKSTKDKRDELITEWSGKSSKLIESEITGLLEHAPRNIAGTVPSPGLGIADRNSVTVDEDGEAIQTKESAPKILTMDDLGKTMTSYLAR